MKKGITLTEGQKKCVDLLNKFKEDPDARFFVLKGVAGVGKGFIVANYILNMFKGIIISATTHKACEAINKEVGREEAITIHKVFGLKLKTSGADEILERDGVAMKGEFLLIDECSMVGDDLLLFIMKSNFRVIFVGDPKQHMPVNRFGAQKVSSCFDVETNYKIFIGDIVRQEAGNPIISLATSIRSLDNGRFNVYKNLGESNIFQTKKTDKEISASCASAINSSLDARVICYTNRKVVEMNMMVHESLYGKTTHPFSVGERVVLNDSYIKNDFIFRNNQEFTVMNVDWVSIDIVSMAIKDSDGRIFEGIEVSTNVEKIEDEVNILFRKWRLNKSDNKSLSMAWDLKKRYAPLRHCYALTSWKIQGQTIDVAFIDIKDNQKIIDDEVFNRSLYVSVTRPKKFLILNYN